MNIRLTLVATASLTAIPVVAAAEEEARDEHHLISEIIVTAKPLQRTVEELAQPTHVLSGDALERRQSSSIGETIADELGVNATYFGPIASRPVIRGQFGERVEMLSNGLSALDASALSEDHAVSLDSILANRVEIIRGPATLLYGSGAAGGVVNIVDSRIAEQPLDEAVSGSVKLGTDSAIGKRAGAFGLDAGMGNVVFHVDYMRRDTDDIEIPGFAESAALRALEEEEEHGEEEHGEEEAFGTVENTDSETEAGAAGLSFVGDRGFIGLSVSTYESNYGLPGAHAHAHEGEEPGAEEEEEEIIRIDLDQTRYDLRGELDFDGFIESAKLKAAFNDYGHVELEGSEVGTRYANEGIDSRIELKHRAIGSLEGAFGIQYKDIDFDAVGDEAFVPPSSSTQIGLFVFEEWAASDVLTFQGSARIEQQEVSSAGLPGYDDTAFGASVGAILGLTDAVSLSGNLSLTERHPNATELYADGAHLAVQRVERGSITQGNGLLDKELSTNFDMTLRADFRMVHFAVTGFMNDVSDYIYLQPTAEIEEELQVFNYNQADAELYGFEAEGIFDLFDRENSHAHVRLFTDYTRGKLSDGGNLPRIPPLRYGLGLHYRTGGLDASVTAMRVDNQDDVAANELPTDAYTMVDAELSYRFSSPDILVFLQGTNLGDEDARRHSSPIKDLIPLPGRSLVAGLRWDF
jgi:iron complex outermembrane receptor protein